MTKIIKPDNKIVTSVPQEMSMDTFIDAIDDAHNSGAFDEILAQDQELDLDSYKEEHKETRAEILLDCLQEAAKMYEAVALKAKRHVKFMIGIKLKSSTEGKHVGHAMGYINKSYMGRLYPITTITIGFESVDQLKESEWGEYLFSMLIRDLFGSADILNDTRNNIKETDLVKEKLRNIKNKPKGFKGINK